MKRAHLAALTLAAACGGHPRQDKSPQPPAATSPAALDAVVADLEALRPFVVLPDGQHPSCEAYTPAATALVASLAAKNPAATTARTAGAPAAIAAWHQDHEAALGKLVTDVAEPIRMVTDCPAVAKDEAWKTISAAIVAVGQRPDVPAAVVKRRALMAELLAGAAKIHAEADCAPLKERLMPQFLTLEGDLHAMSALDRFIDDKVWEEEDEHHVESDPDGKRLVELCKL
jgi:hypothetical protein